MEFSSSRSPDETFRGAAFLSSLEECDPSLREGGRLTLDCELPVEIRLPAPEDDAGTGAAARGYASCAAGAERLRFKIISRRDDRDVLRAVLVEVMSDSDPFFHYRALVREGDFETLQVAHRLTISWPQLPETLASLCAQAAAPEPNDVRCALALRNEPTTAATLEFVSVALAFRFVELFSLELQLADASDTRLLVAFRYHELTSKLAYAEARYDDLAAAVLDHHPQLLDGVPAQHRARAP